MSLKQASATWYATSGSRCVILNQRPSQSPAAVIAVGGVCATVSGVAVGDLFGEFGSLRSQPLLKQRVLKLTLRTAVNGTAFICPELRSITFKTLNSQPIWLGADRAKCRSRVASPKCLKDLIPTPDWYPTTHNFVHVPIVSTTNAKRSRAVSS